MTLSDLFIFLFVWGWGVIGVISFVHFICPRSLWNWPITLCHFQARQIWEVLLTWQWVILEVITAGSWVLPETFPIEVSLPQDHVLIKLINRKSGGLVI